MYVFNDETAFLRLLLVENGEMRPGPERLRLFRQLSVPSDMKALRRCLGLFAYYSNWIYNFSKKVRSVIDTAVFPVSPQWERHSEP